MDRIESSHQQAIVALQDRSLTVGTGATINPSDVVRDLGVLFDSELTMKKHIAKVAAVCFFHIRRLRQIRRRVGNQSINQSEKD